MTREELKESVKVLKKSAKNTVGNREKNNKFTVIADIKPDSFDYIMSQVIEALSEPTPTIKTDGHSLTEVAEALKRHGLMAVDDSEAKTGKITCNSCSYEIELSEPTRPKAKWIERDLESYNPITRDRKIYVCSNCHLGIDSSVNRFANYCPNCGAEMESEE